MINGLAGGAQRLRLGRCDEFSPGLVEPDQVRMLEHAEMLDDALQRHVQGAGEFGGRARPVRQPAQDCASVRICQGFENVGESSFCLIHHEDDFIRTGQTVNLLVHFGASPREIPQKRPVRQKRQKRNISDRKGGTTGFLRHVSTWSDRKARSRN